VSLKAVYYRRNLFPKATNSDNKNLESLLYLNHLYIYIHLYLEIYQTKTLKFHITNRIQSILFNRMQIHNSISNFNYGISHHYGKSHMSSKKTYQFKNYIYYWRPILRLSTETCSTRPAMIYSAVA
jgi:hypothetical protein